MDTATTEILERIRANGYSVVFNENEELDNDACEILKTEACAILRSNWPLQARAYALLVWIETQYWPAKRILEKQPKIIQRLVHGKRYSPGYKLSMIVYTEHWLYANGDRVEEQDVVQYVKDKFDYQPEKSKFLPKGCTIYQVNP